MNSERRIAKVERQVEESMLPRDWAALFADQLASCAELHCFMNMTAQAATREETLWGKPVAIYQRLGRNGDFEKFRDMAFEYRCATTLALNINSLLAARMSEERGDHYALQYRLLLLERNADSTHATAAHSRCAETIGGKEMILIERIQTAAALRLGWIRTWQRAADLVARCHFSGHAFLFQVTRGCLLEFERRYEDMLYPLTLHLPDDVACDPGKVGPTDHTVESVAKAWTEEAMMETRPDFFPDGPCPWAQFRAMTQKTMRYEINPGRDSSYPANLGEDLVPEDQMGVETDTVFG